MILRIGDATLRDAACLNLRGVIEESRQEWKSARRWYGKAIRVDRSHPAAQQNMRRIYELYTFGWSKQPVALGDERRAFFELMKAREQSRGMQFGDSAGDESAVGPELGTFPPPTIASDPEHA